MTDITLYAAASAVLARWDSPQWEWLKHGPTADLMHALRLALAAAPAQEHADPQTDWPIARLRFDDSGAAVGVVKTYTPGLPAGEHDVWCCPVAAQPAEAVMLNGLTEAETLATASVAGLTKGPPSAAVQRDAARYQWLRSWTRGERFAKPRFALPSILPAPGADILHGSVAQHLDAAIDAIMNSDAQVTGIAGEKP